jgi:hypothetical protein
MVDLIGDIQAPYALLTSSRRKIGTIYPDVTIEEVHHDDLIITEHPVEKGSAITDHSYKRPEELDMRVGFSNSSAQTEGYVQQVYQDILALQATREPFDVDTGKRHYTDMLIAGITQTTDVHTEWALMLVVRLKRIKFAQAQTSASSGTSSQSNPAATAPETPLGTQQPKELPSGQQDTYLQTLGTIGPGTVL